MNPIPKISILFLGLALPALTQAASTAKLIAASPVADGVYTGLEPMPSDSPDRPDAPWYHENTILVMKELGTTLKSEPLEYDGKHPYFPRKNFPDCKLNDSNVLDD